MYKRSNSYINYPGTPAAPPLVMRKDIPDGAVFTGVLCPSGDAGPQFKGLFLKTDGNEFIFLHSPGQWINKDYEKAYVRDYKQVDIEIMVKPHVP